MLLKVLHSVCHKIRKTQKWPQDWKSLVCIPIAKKGNDKECSNYSIVQHIQSKTALISHASKVIFKILQARFQQYVNWELSDVQAGFRKGRVTRDQIANIHWAIEKQGNSRKISALLTTLKPLTVWIITNCGKFLKTWEYQAILPVSWETCMWVVQEPTV